MEVLDPNDDLLDAIRRFKPRRKVLAKGAKEPSRNAPCPCESGLKYKRCCGREQRLAEAEEMRK